MELAKRLSKLGTETAFAVSAEAARHVALGKRVYPFHLGDMNIKTPDNIIEATYKAMKDGKTGYCPNYGIAKLRELLAEDINRSHGTDYTIDNVAVQPGGKPTISKFFMAMMNAGDEVLYPNPGYPIYESQIEFQGGIGLPYTYHEGKENFELDIEGIERKITPRTKLIVVNDLQNPMGAEASRQELEALADVIRRHNLFVLCDEAYFDIRYVGKSLSLASLPGMAERCLLLYTFSKKFAMTGWRLGASIGPKEVIDVVAKLNVNDESCSNHFIQYGAIEGLTGDQSGPRRIVETLRARRDMAVAMLNSIDGIRCFKPNATFYLFPNVTEVMKRRGFDGTPKTQNTAFGDPDDYGRFRQAALEETGVSFCTRLHFGRALPGESESYIRFAYSGIDVGDIEEGLTGFKKWLES
jgi:aspartate/methionine/tyrosine aminotransferase